MEMEVNAKNLSDITKTVRERQEIELMKQAKIKADELICLINSDAVAAAERGEMATRISLASSFAKQPNKFKDLLIGILESYYTNLGFHTSIYSGTMFGICWNNLEKDEPKEPEDPGSDEDETEKIDGD